MGSRDRHRYGRRTALVSHTSLTKDVSVEPKEMIMAWLALLAVLAVSFVSIRNEVREVSLDVAHISERVDSLTKYCCEELR